MNTKTFYNPETNEIRSVQHWSTWTIFGSMASRGYVNLGYKKIAEAFTSVSSEERPILWKSLTEGKTYSFDFSMLNSKLRHKLKRLGLYQFPKREISRGQDLLDKINKKKK